MGIFKDITHRYCQKVLDAYQLQVDEKTIKGKEAELLIQRNDFAKCLIKKIKEVEVKNQDYVGYFEQILDEINLVLKDVSKAVEEYNKEYSTAFTSDLYESFFTSGLISFIKALRDLFQNSPSVITDIDDASLFNNDKNVPWVYQFSSVLYEYILEREFDIAVNKVDRDIFDTKKRMILKYIQNAGNLYSRFENENDSEYKELMKVLLNSMSSEEKSIQRRKSDENNSSYVYSYFSQTLFKASEKIIGKSILGQKIEFLESIFQERTTNNKGLVH